MERNTDTDTAAAVVTTAPIHSEVTDEQLENVIGGFLAFTFKLVAVKTISWAHDD